MKSWYEFWPLILLFGLLPFVMGLVPTTEFKGSFYGGGVVREATINAATHIMPTKEANAFVKEFMDSTTSGEYKLYLPFAMNMSLLLMWCAYFIGSVVMTINNQINKRSYQARRLSAKG